MLKIKNIMRKLYFFKSIILLVLCFSFSQCGFVGDIFFNNILDPPKWQNYKRENVKAPIQPILQDEIVSSARTKPGDFMLSFGLNNTGKTKKNSRNSYWDKEGTAIMNKNKTAYISLGWTQNKTWSYQFKYSFGVNSDQVVMVGHNTIVPFSKAEVSNLSPVFKTLNEHNLIDIDSTTATTNIVRTNNIIKRESSYKDYKICFQQKLNPTKLTGNVFVMTYVLGYGKSNNVGHYLAPQNKENLNYRYTGNPNYGFHESSYFSVQVQPSWHWIGRGFMEWEIGTNLNYTRCRINSTILNPNLVAASFSETNRFNQWIFQPHIGAYFGNGIYRLKTVIGTNLALTRIPPDAIHAFYSSVGIQFFLNFRKENFKSRS